MKTGRTPLFATALLLFSAALTLVGCQKPYVIRADANLAAAGDYTGGTTEDGKLLTAASNDGGIQILKESIPQTSGKNGDLATAIRSTHIEFFDRKGKPVTNNPERLKIQIRLKDESGTETNLDFETALFPGKSNTRIFSNARSRQTAEFRLSAVCSDQSCFKIVMRLMNSNSSDKAEAGFIYRIRDSVQVRSTGASDAASFANSPALRTIQKSMTTGSKTSRLETQEVAWGTSSFSLQFEGEGGSKFCLSGRLVETNDEDESLQILTCGGKPSTISAIMIGNDNAGSLIVRLQERTAMLIVLIISQDGLLADIDGTKPSTEVKVPPQVAETAKLPSEARNPVTQAFESDRVRPEIIEAISKWTSVNRTPDNIARMRQFVARIQPNLGVIASAFAKSAVPMELLAITAIESSYFTAPGYPIEVNPVSSAAGPWQMVDNTARGNGLRIFSTANAKKINPCDQRGYLNESTVAAGKYFRSLLNMFPNDPRLAVLGYFWGQGHVTCLDRGDIEKCAAQIDRDKKTPLATKVARLQTIRAANFNFWTVKAFNMGRKDAPEYVIRFLAAQFVAREPHRYGVDLMPTNEIAKIPAAVNPVCK